MSASFYPAEAFKEWCPVRGGPDSPTEKAAAEARLQMQKALRDARSPMRRLPLQPT